MVTGRGGLTALGEPRGLADAVIETLGWEQDFLTRKEKRRDSST